MKIGDEDVENDNPEFARFPKNQTKRLTRFQNKPGNAAEEIHLSEKKISQQAELNCDKLPNSDYKIKNDAELDRDFREAVDKFTELVEDDDERFGVADVMELEVETRQKVFGVAAMNPSPRYSGDHEFQIYMEVACAVLCNMVLLAKLKNPLKTKADAMVELEHEEGCYERFGLEEVTEDEVGTGTCAEEEAQQVELPSKENNEPVEEMHEGLNKFPPDNCANEPTAVESCSRVTANMGVTLMDALENGVMVANEELANGELDKQLDSTKVKKVPEEPPVKKVSEDGEDQSLKTMSDHVKQVHDCAKLLNEFASLAEKEVLDEPPEHESLFLLLYDYGAEKQQQRDLAKEVNVEVDAFRADGRLCVVKEVFPDVKGNVRNVEVKVMNSFKNAYDNLQN